MLANPKTDWKMMAINSHFQTAEAAQTLLQQGQNGRSKSRPV